MLEARPCEPGMLLLEGDRVLVAGGMSYSAEVLRLPRGDQGQWTLIDCRLHQEFMQTRLANVGGRIYAICKLVQ